MYIQLYSGSLIFNEFSYIINIRSRLTVMLYGGGWRLVALLVFKTSRGAVLLSWVGSIPTHSRQFKYGFRQDLFLGEQVLRTCPFFALRLKIFSEKEMAILMEIELIAGCIVVTVITAFGFFNWINSKKQRNNDWFENLPKWARTLFFIGFLIFIWAVYQLLVSPSAILWPQ